MLSHPSSTLQYCAQEPINPTDKAGAIAIVAGMLAMLLPASVTWTVNAKLPAVAGVPEMEPSVPNVRPAGKVPLNTLHEYGAAAPVADRATGEYPTPTSPA